jgi:hypothetical protein
MKEFPLQYIYTWKCHNEVSCTGIKNIKMSFLHSKTENRKAKQLLSGGLVPAGWGGYKEIVKEGKYSGNMYTCM